MQDSTTVVKKILVAEDEQGMRELIVDVLESAGFSVIAVATGTEAITCFSKRRGEIDLVILDMIMPGMGGDETFRELKKNGIDVPVLLSSGYEKVQENLISEGVAGFIGKPYRIDALVEKVKRTVENKKED